MKKAKLDISHSHTQCQLPTRMPQCSHILPNLMRFSKRIMQWLLVICVMYRERYVVYKNQRLMIFIKIILLKMHRLLNM
jgi:hypothetical protein